MFFVTLTAHYIIWKAGNTVSYTPFIWCGITGHEQNVFKICNLVQSKTLQQKQFLHI